MKKSTLLFLYFVTICSGLSLAQTLPSPTTTKTTFSNPLPVQLGDPYILQTKGMYYMYGTGGGADKGFVTYSSKDMVNWKPEGQVYFHDNKNGWSDPTAGWGGAYWAPEVYEVKGKYYLFLQRTMESEPYP